MKSSAGLFLIILALFGLWLYNTGRAEAILAIIKDPNTARQPGGVGGAGAGSGAPLLGGNSGGTGGTTAGQIAVCYETNASGMVDPGCIEEVWKGLNSPEDILKTVGGFLGGFF